MTKKIRVNVTQRDIERGTPERSDICPIARAARRHEGLREAFVAQTHVELVWPSRVVELPPEARVFILAFDKGHPVAPFSFDLEVP